MRTKVERKIDHIINQMVRKYDNVHFMQLNHNFFTKKMQEIIKLENAEIYEFLMKLFSEKHNDEFVKAIISHWIIPNGVYFHRQKKYDGKNFIQLAIENDYSVDVINKLFSGFFYNVDSKDKNGFTILHTLVNSNVSNMFLKYKIMIPNNLERIKDNNGETYIDLVKKQINKNKISLTEKEITETWSSMVKEVELKNILCDYYYRNFDEFLDMLTDDVEKNKQLITDNLIFTDYTIAEENDYEKYDVSKLLFRCIDSNKDFNNYPYIYKNVDNKFLIIIKKLMETGYPKIDVKENDIDFISYAIKKRYNLDFIFSVFDICDELGKEIPDWLYYEVLKTYVIVESGLLYEGKLLRLYDNLCNRGFNLLNVDIRKQFIERIELKIHYLDGIFNSNVLEEIKKIIIEINNACVINKINNEFLELNYNTTITSFRNFSDEKLVDCGCSKDFVREVALRIIGNRKDAIYVSDEITKEEVISAIEECKPILDEMYKTQGSSDYNKINTNFARADGEIIKNFENELIYVKKR